MRKKSTAAAGAAAGDFASGFGLMPLAGSSPGGTDAGPSPGGGGCGEGGGGGGAVASITSPAPAKRRQAIVRSPPLPQASAGPLAGRPAAERFSIAERAAPGATSRRWTMRSEPSKRLQSPVAVPSGATSSCGSPASRPDAERSGVLGATPPAGLI